MSTTLDKSRRPSLADKHRQQEEDRVKAKKLAGRKKEEDSKGRSLKVKKDKKHDKKG